VLRRSAIVLTAVFGLVFTTLALAQPPFQPPPNASIPPDARIFLYPITRFRGTPAVLTASDPTMPIASAESIVVVRGVWDLCSEKYYYGKCIRVSSTMTDIPIAIVVRSAHLVGDAGPTFTEAPVARAGPDIPMQHENRIVEARPTPAPVVAPKVEEGGKAGDNPSLAGVSETKFFAAPAQNGLRVLACAGQAGPKPAARCVQASADGFCVSVGLKESAYRETELVDGKAYLSNVLCKSTPDEPARDSAGSGGGGGLRIPFLKRGN